jgi:hypothetical protein
VRKLLSIILRSLIYVFNITLLPILNGKILLIVPIVFVLCIIQSCTSFRSANRLYQGPPLPKDKVALLVTMSESLIHPARVNIQSVDGKEIEHSSWDGTVKVEFLPGSHVIKADYISNRDFSYYLRDTIEIHINAQPGHVYQVDAEDVGMSCRTFVRDITAKY